MNIIKVKTTESTNRLLKELTEKQIIKEGTAVFTEVQTAGRGQMGTCWEAEPGKNITCSLLLYPDFLSLAQQFLLSETVALGVKETLDDYLAGRNNQSNTPNGASSSIKWANDIYFGNRKIAGILIENELLHRKITQSVIGIGFNVNQEVFSGAASNPVSLKQILGREISLYPFLEKMLGRIMYWYDCLKAGQYEIISKAYHAALYRKSGFHTYEDKNGRFSAQIRSVSTDGFLHLTTEQGEERRYAFKEATFVIEQAD